MTHCIPVVHKGSTLLVVQGLGLWDLLCKYPSQEEVRHPWTWAHKWEGVHPGEVTGAEHPVFSVVASAAPCLLGAWVVAGVTLAEAILTWMPQKTNAVSLTTAICRLTARLCPCCVQASQLHLDYSQTHSVWFCLVYYCPEMSLHSMVANAEQLFHLQYKQICCLLCLAGIH